MTKESPESWETFTPPEPPNPREGAIIQYDLEMYVDAADDSVGQDVSITREEFIKLKDALTRIRSREDHQVFDGICRLEAILTATWEISRLADDKETRIFEPERMAKLLSEQIALAMDLAERLKSPASPLG